MPDLPIDFSRFEVTDDQGVRLLSACCDLVLYMDCSYEKASAGLLYALDRFVERCPASRLTWYRMDSMDEHKPVTNRTVGMLRGWLKPGAKSRDQIGIELNDAKNFESTADHSFYLHAMSKRSEDFEDFSSTLRIALPPQWLEADSAGFRELVVDVASRTPFTSGHAGFCLNATEYGETESVALAYPLLLRHPGLDFARLTDAAYDVKPGYIKCVNWLTFLSKPLVTKLGGPTVVRDFASRSATTTVVSVGEGCVLQSSERPEVGDLNRRVDASAYRETARLIAPLLAPQYSCLPLISDEATEKTQAWFHRFVPS